MALYQHNGISIESWVEMNEDIGTPVEVDRLNDQATLFFGARNDYVLCLRRDTLRRVADLADKAHTELDTAQESDED